MLPAATVRALTIPAFTAAQFVPTQWVTADDKAKFANALMKFITADFPRQGFTRSLYHCLSNTFGHIAHANLDGFYGAFFERDFDKVVFLEQTLSWLHFGDATFTFSDVERAVKRRLQTSKVIDIVRMLEADATRRREFATLCRLQEKYGTRPPAPDFTPIGSKAAKTEAVDDTSGRQTILPLDPDRAMPYDRHSHCRGKPERAPTSIISGGDK